MRKGFVSGGCYYPPNYKWIAYPLSSSPHGGNFIKPPLYYQDYDEQYRKSRERERQAKNKDDEERWAKFARKFAQGFFGIPPSDEEENEAKQRDEPDYPYSVFGLKKSASNEDMKFAYRKSLLKSHPDRGGTSEAFRIVRSAWEYFCNFVK